MNIAERIEKIIKVYGIQAEDAGLLRGIAQPHIQVDGQTATQAYMDAFLNRAGWGHGWNHLDDWDTKRIAQQAVREIKALEQRVAELGGSKTASREFNESDARALMDAHVDSGPAKHAVVLTAIGILQEQGPLPVEKIATMKYYTLSAFGECMVVANEDGTPAAALFGEIEAEAKCKLVEVAEFSTICAKYLGFSKADAQRIVERELAAIGR